MYNKDGLPKDRFIPWAFHHDLLIETYEAIMQESSEWGGLTIDSSDYHREATCHGFESSDHHKLDTTLGRASLFHSLVGEIFAQGVSQGLFPGFIDRVSLKRFLTDVVLPPDLGFYLLVEQASTGSTPLLDLIAEKLAFISVVVSAQADRVLTPSLRSEKDWTITTCETAVLMGTTHTSGEHFVPGNGLLFVYSSSPLQVGSRRAIPVQRLLPEGEVMLSIARHFFLTGEPPHDVISIDLASLNVDERVVDPRTFEQAVQMTRNAFRASIRPHKGMPLELTVGPWCSVCDERTSCPALDIDDEEPFL